MNTIFDSVVTEPLKDFFQKFLKFMPNLLSSVIIFILGFVAAWILKIVISKVLGVLNFDRFCEKFGMTEELARAGIKDTPTNLLSRILYWLVVIVFTIIALSTLKVPAIENLIEAFFLYLPNLFIAALIIIVGYMLSNFLGRATLIASVNAGIEFSSLLSRGVKTIIFLFAVAMALEQLGIGRETVVVAFTILFGGFVFALALAFGLAGKDIAKEYLEKKFKAKETEKRDELKHL